MTDIVVAAAADYEKQEAVAVTADYAGSYVPPSVEVAASDLAPSDCQKCL